MPSTRYDVYTEFRIRDSRLRSSMRGIQRDAGEISRSIERIHSGFGRLAAYGGTVLGGIGGYLGARAAKAGLIDYNNRMEQLRMSIGGATSMMVQFGTATSAVENYARSMVFARAATAELRKDAAKLIGETEDFTSAFSMLIGPMAQTGLARTSNELGNLTREMVGLTVAASAALLQGDVRQGMSDIMRMMLGQAGAEMRMAQILQITGKEAERFNKLRVSDRYKELYRRLVDLKPAFKDFETSWEGLTSTMVDKGKLMMGQLGEPVFGRLKEYIRGVNEWMEDNEEQIDRLAQAYGTKLASALDRVLDKLDPTSTNFVDLEKNLDSIGEAASDAATAAKWFVGIWATWKIGSFVLELGKIATHIKEIGLAAVSALPAIKEFMLYGPSGVAWNMGKLSIPFSAAVNSQGLGALAGAAPGGVGLTAGAHFFGMALKEQFQQREESRAFQQQYLDSVERNRQLQRENLAKGLSAKEIAGSYLRIRSATGSSDYAFQEAAKRLHEASPHWKDRMQRFWFRQQLGNQLLAEGVGRQDIRDLMEYFPGQVTTLGEMVKSKSKTGGGKKIKMKQPKIVQNIYNPRLDVHLDNLEDLEPDRIAVIVGEKLNQSFMSGGVKGMSAALKLAGM